MLVEIIILVLFLMMSAFFSGSETAFMAVSRIKAQTLAKQKVPGAETLVKLKQEPRKLIITILIGNNIANIGASALATAIAIDFFGNAGAGIATGVMTLIVLIFGEITPKSYATVHAASIACRLAKPIMFISRILHPLVLLFEYMTREVISWFGSHRKTPLFSEAELRTLVEMGVKEKRLETTEKEFIEGVLEFNDITVKKVMTPKNRMFCLRDNVTISKALKEINKREHTRVPIYRGTRDNVIGFLYLKDLLKVVAEGNMQVRVKTIMRRPLFVKQTTVISHVFKEFQTRHVHMAVVINKDHDVVGVATLEDVLEEIVGEILDETDISPELIKRINKTAIICHGDTEVNDINQFFNIALPHMPAEQTLNQFLATIYKKKWTNKTVIKYKDVTFIIKHVENNQPFHVMIEKK